MGTITSSVKSADATSSCHTAGAGIHGANGFAVFFFFFYRHFEKQWICCRVKKITVILSPSSIECLGWQLSTRTQHSPMRFRNRTSFELSVSAFWQLTVPDMETVIQCVQSADATVVLLEPESP